MDFLLHRIGFKTFYASCQRTSPASRSVWILKLARAAISMFSLQCVMVEQFGSRAFMVEIGIQFGSVILAGLAVMIVYLLHLTWGLYKNQA